MTQADNQAQGLLAGVARAVITPPIGTRMVGYTVQGHVSQSIERELTATALVVASGGTKVAILACDLLFVQNPHAERFRSQIGARIGVPAEHVLINCSHTHLAPMPPGWQGAQSSEEETRQQRAFDLLADTLAGVAEAADRSLQPARVGVARGTAPLGVNRRERLDDGRVIIGENPTGPIDRDVHVLRIDDLAGWPLATVMVAACHTVVLGPATTELSPDFIGPAREIVEGATGAPSLFLQGAAGSTNPACGIGRGGADQADDLVRMGAMLAGETLKVWSQIRTHNRRGPRRIVQSVATVSTWDYEPMPVEPIPLAVRERRRTLALAPPPDVDAADRQAAHYARLYDEARARGASPGELNVAHRLAQWGDLVARTAREGKPVLRDLLVWGLRLGDAAIVAVNGEPLAELALEVKGRSTWPQTIFLGYSNGCLGYLPPPSAFAEGGMEVVESCRNYMIPSFFTPEWGPAVVETALEILSELTQNGAHR